ncbi:hypothetical protein AAVH_39519 [Aphelenchoides avenae]|nr:hypothetical protein AAVH_39519 [Aphelenchus avenae]
MIGKSDSFPRPNTYWFRDWFYPIYRDFGETTAQTAALNNFFSLLAMHVPKNGQSYARRMNLGEFVHFLSGAAKQNLRDVARAAFGTDDRNGDDWVAQFDRARQDFPGVQYRLTPVRPPAPPPLNASFVVYDGKYHTGTMDKDAVLYAFVYLRRISDVFLDIRLQQ